MTNRIRILLSVFAVGIFSILAASAAFAQLPVIGGEGMTLEDLVDSSSLVTVVLKSGAVESNLKITAVYDRHFNATGANGKFKPFLLEQVQEIRVQSGEVQQTTLDPEELTALRPEDQEVLIQAETQAEKVYQISDDVLPLKMRSAALIGHFGNSDVLNYLRRRLSGNDLQQALDAGIALYVAGASEQSYEDIVTIVRRGLQSVNRNVRASALRLAGLVQYEGAESNVVDLLRDRTAEIYVPAALAAGRLKIERAVPKLIEGLESLNDDKGEAAVVALTKIGGPEVVAELKSRLDRLHGFERFRAVRVLYRLGDEDAKREMADTYLYDVAFRNPRLEVKPAFILARNGNWEATNILIEELQQVDDPILENLQYRARAAMALVAGGHLQAVAEVQNLLKLTENSVIVPGATAGDRQNRRKLLIIKLRDQICRLAAEYPSRRLIPVIQPVVRSSTDDASVILSACEAVVAISDAEYRMRLLESRL